MNPTHRLTGDTWRYVTTANVIGQHWSQRRSHANSSSSKTNKCHLLQIARRSPTAGPRSTGFSEDLGTELQRPKYR